MTERKPLEPIWQVNELGQRRALYTADQIREMVEEVRVRYDGHPIDDARLGALAALDALLAQLEGTH